MAKNRENREAMSGGVNPSGFPRASSLPEVQNPPSESVGPHDSAGAAMGETADPNFTAASRAREEAASSDAAVPRMDTGRGLSAIPPMSPKAEHGGCVSDLMTNDVAVCEPGTEVYYVARMMEDRDCGAIPVVESTDSMKPIGIVTDRDIVVRGVAKNQNALRLTAGDVMSVDVLCVFPDMSIDECVQKMEQREVRRAVVVDHTGRCCGIIALADIARGTNEREAGEMVQQISQPDPMQMNQHYH